MSIQKASSADAQRLTRLACASEQQWGYDREYMRQFAEHYAVTDDFIRQNPVYLLLEQGCLLGFWALCRQSSGWELEHFYVDAQQRGKGCGRRLWNSLLDYCRQNSVDGFGFVTSPQAVPFYEKMGAVVVGQTQSLLQQGRAIPRLHYSVE